MGSKSIEKQKREKSVKSIQEIFRGRFADARFAAVQKCDKSIKKNLEATQTGYTNSWPRLNEQTELVVLVFKDVTPREIWVGKLQDQIPDGERFGFLVDKFELVGVHDPSVISDADFYGTGAGGGSRVNVTRSSGSKRPVTSTSRAETAPGEMVQRLVWLRKNHAKFKDPVWKHWAGQCAVTRSACNQMLVASHIKPWSVSSPAEKTDLHNGLLLATPIDALFDRGLVSFSDRGDLLLGAHLSSDTAVIFGVRKGMKINAARITQRMRTYLAWHRDNFGFE